MKRQDPVDFQPSEAHWRIDGWKERVSLREAQQVLRRGPYTRWGKLCDFKAKQLGCGIYELTLVEVDL